MRIYKDYYEMSFGGLVGVAFDESTMKKVSKVQAKAYHELMELLASADDIQFPNWSIAEEPKELSQEDRTFRYFDDKDREELIRHLNENLKNMFSVRKIENLYSVNGRYSTSRELAEKEHAEYLESIKEVSND